MKVKISLTKAIYILGTAMVLGSKAVAGPVSYAQKFLNIRSGVLVIDSNQVGGFAQNQAPFVLFDADRNSVDKPSGWNFYNPHASAYVTADMSARWQAQTGFAPTIGSPLDKASAGYWEVPLGTVSDSAITDYDLLVLPVYRALSLDPEEKEKLQRFMDAGGILWIDTATTTVVDAANPSPIPFSLTALPGVASGDPILLQQDSKLGGGGRIKLSTIPSDADPANGPLVNIVPIDFASNGYASLQTILSPNEPLFQNLGVEGIGQNSGASRVMLASVGKGYMVVTAGRTMAYSEGNTFTFYANHGALTVPSAVDSFITNLVSLTGAPSSNASGPKGDSSIAVDLNGPLLKSFSAEDQPGTLPDSPPVTYKGLVFVTSGNRLYAYSAKPGSDLDHNGIADDGPQDYSLGKTYDLVWQSVPMSGPLSGPSIITEPGLPGGQSEQVGVVDGNGDLNTFIAFPLNGSGTFINFDNPVIHTYTAPNGAAAAPAVAPFAPVEANGLVYVTDNTSNVAAGESGRIWAADPRSQTVYDGWAIGSSVDFAFHQASEGATIGWIPSGDNAGGSDLVAYIPTVTQGSTTGPCGIASVWIATQGEHHDLTINASNQLQIVTRASNTGTPIFTPSGGNPYGIKLSLLNSDGDVLTVAQMANLVDGTVTDNNGVLTFGLKAGVNLANFTAAGVTAVSIDYYIDWNNSNPDALKAVRGTLELPDDTDNSKVILDKVAIGDDGTLYLTEANPTSGSTNGSYFAIKEQTRGQFAVLNRWDLTPSLTYQVPGGKTSSNWPITLEDNDPVQSFAPPFIGGAFKSLVFESGPSVSGENVIVKAKGTKGLFKVPCTVVLCFKAHPGAPTIVTSQLQTPFTIQQPDDSRSPSADKTTPNIFTTVVSNQYQYEAEGAGGKITFNSLASSQTAGLSQVLNQSMPVIIRQSGRPDVVLDPSTSSPSWNPLRWYMVFHGIDDTFTAGGIKGRTGTPVITGSTAYVAGNSITAAIFSGVNPLKATPIGILLGLDTQVSGNDTFLTPNGFRTYQQQLIVLKVNPDGSIAADPHILWPSNKGITSFTTYRQRLLQSTLGGNDVVTPRKAFGISAGDGALFAYGPLGLYGFTKADFTVADSGRIGDYDPTGNPITVTDTTSEVNFGESTIRYNAPSKVYKTNDGNTVVVDPLGNQIIVQKPNGSALRQLKTFVGPTGYAESTSLNNPSDALSYTDFSASASSPTGFVKNSHLVVADSGNNRILDIANVDPYNPATGFSYSGVSNTLVSEIGPDVIGNVTMTSLAAYQTSGTVFNANPHVVYVAGIKEGGFIVIDSGNRMIVKTMTVPAIPVGVQYDPSTDTYNSTVIPQADVPIGRVNSLTIGNGLDAMSGAAVMRVMVTTDRGVFELNYPLGTMETAFTSNNPASETSTINWMLPTATFSRLFQSGTTIYGNEPLQFKPTFAKRTTSGSVIIVNNYVGKSISQVGGVNSYNLYGGEVMEIDGSPFSVNSGSGFSFTTPDYGFSPLSILFELNGIQGARSLLAPVCADRN